MGWIANFMASSVLTGFMVGLAIVIATGQLDKILGVESEGGNVLQELGSMLSQFSDWDWPTICVGVVALGRLVPDRGVRPEAPGSFDRDAGGDCGIGHLRLRRLRDSCGR